MSEFDPDALSAVYTYFDPQQSKYSPGVFAVLTQLELCRRWQLPYLYLNLYINNYKTIPYKANYRPHERLLDGAWVRFER